MGRFIGPIVATGAVLMGLFMFLFTKSILSWAYLAALIIGLMLIGSPRALFFIYMGWITINLYAQALIPTTLVQFADEALTAALFVVLFHHHIVTRRPYPELKALRLVLVPLLAIWAVSAYVNHASKVFSVMYLGQYFRFFLIFIYAYHFLHPGDFGKVIGFIISVFLIQVALNTAWFIGINPLFNWKLGGPDFAIGTLAGCNVVAYFTVAVICLLVSLFVNFTDSRYRLLLAGLLGVALFQLYITYTFHAYMLLAMCLGILLIPLLANPRASQVLATYLVIMLMLPIGWLLLPESLAAKQVFNTKTLVYRWGKFIHGPKMESYYNNIFVIPKEVPVALLGAGPGEGGSVVGMGRMRPIAAKYFRWVSDSVDAYRISEGASMTSGPATGVLSIWSDLGPVAMLIYWSFFFYAIGRVCKRLYARAYENRLQRCLAEAFVPAMSLILMIAFLTDFMHMAFINNSIWVWAACVWTPVKLPAPAPAPARVAGSRTAPAGLPLLATRRALIR